MDDQVMDFAETVYETISVYSMDVLGALVLLIVGWIVAGWARGVTVRLMGRSARLDKTIQPLIANGVKYVILVFVLVACGQVRGADDQPDRRPWRARSGGRPGPAGHAVERRGRGDAADPAPVHVGEYIDAEGTAARSRKSVCSPVGSAPSTASICRCRIRSSGAVRSRISPAIRRGESTCRSVLPTMTTSVSPPTP